MAVAGRPGCLHIYALPEGGPLLYYIFWFLLTYAFLGWCAEVCFAALSTGRFVNRGFLNGPLCPIYGFGAVLVLVCLEPLGDNLLLLFLGSVVLTSFLEWFTGFLLEKLFHQRWWDYSEEPFNIGGYIFLRFSLAWGLACLFVVKVVHPAVQFLIGSIPRPLGWVLLAIFGVVLAVDLAATLRTIAKINRSLGQIDELAGKIREVSDGLGEDLAERVLETAEKGADWKDILEERRAGLQGDLDSLRESLTQRRADYQQRKGQRTADAQKQLEELRGRLQELLDADVFGQRRLLSAFPKMRSLDHRQALERLRRRMERKNKSGK